MVYAHPLPSYPPKQATSNWTACSAPCGPASTGYKFRAVQCVSVPSATQPSSAVAPAALCDAGNKPLALELCAGEACPQGYWLTNGTWTPCSAPCVANASDTSALGVSTRAPPVCMVVRGAPGSTATPSDNAQCEALGLVRAATCAGARASLCVRVRVRHCVQLRHSGCASQCVLAAHIGCACWPWVWRVLFWLLVWPILSLHQSVRCAAPRTCFAPHLMVPHPRCHLPPLGPAIEAPAPQQWWLGVWGPGGSAAPRLLAPTPLPVHPGPYSTPAA